MIYLVTYDLHKPTQNYAAVHQAIKSCGSWWHHLESTWLVDTTLSASQIWDRIKGAADNDDNFLIIRVTKDFSGWLPQAAWDWLNQRQLAA